MPARKSIELRKGHRGPSRVTSALAKPNSDIFEIVPNPPRNIIDTTRIAWEEFWTSDLAPFVRKTDLAALRRLFVHYDELDRTRSALYKEPPARPERGPSESYNEWQIRMRQWRIECAARGRLTASPKGGVSLNPLLSYMRQLESMIVNLEDRFGLNMRSRMDLGVTALRAESLAEQNAAQLKSFREANDNGNAAGTEDPRTTLLVTGSDSRRKAAS